MSDFSNALWLKSRDLLPESRSKKPAFLILGVYVLATVLLCWGTTLLPDFAATSLDSTLLLTSPLWLLWAVIPFTGTGAGDIESSLRLAPYPVNSRVHLFSTWISAFLDFPYLIGLPLLLATAYSAGGVQGVILVFALTLGASALGQFGSWLSGAFGFKKKGESLSSMIFFLLLISLLSLTPLSIQTAFVYLPPGWFISGLEAASVGSLTSTLLWSLALLSPLLLVLFFTPRLVQRTLRIRAEGFQAKSRPWGARARNLPPSLSVVLAMTASSVRSLTVKAVFISVLSIPFLSSLAFGLEMVSAPSMAFFVAFASSATVSINLWAFDASGTQLWLSWPLSTRRLLYMRLLSSLLVLLIIETVVLGAFFILSNFEGINWADTSRITLMVVAVCSIAGLAVSTFRPSSVDFDSLRARPNTFPAAISFITRIVLGSAAILIVFLLAGPWVALGVLILLGLLTVERLIPKVKDGSVLTSALK